MFDLCLFNRRENFEESVVVIEFGDLGFIEVKGFSRVRVVSECWS